MLLGYYLCILVITVLLSGYFGVDGMGLDVLVVFLFVVLVCVFNIVCLTVIVYNVDLVG